MNSFEIYAVVGLPVLACGIVLSGNRLWVLLVRGIFMDRDHSLPVSRRFRGIGKRLRRTRKLFRLVSGHARSNPPLSSRRRIVQT
jgi:hypothetical protein